MSRALVNFFYAHPVGHAVEALHYAHGHHVADPGLEISVALNAATAVELARFCPFVERAYAIDHPLLEPCPDSAARLAGLPREWDWIAAQRVDRYVTNSQTTQSRIRAYFGRDSRIVYPPVATERHWRVDAMLRPCSKSSLALVSPPQRA